MSLVRRVALVVVLCASCPLLRAQQEAPRPPVGEAPAARPTPAPPAPTPPADPNAGPAGGRRERPARRGGEGTQEEEGGGRRGGRGEGRGSGEGRGGEGTADETPKEPRRGIPVTEPLLLKHCIGCHKVDDQNLMGRISYLRKAPEGWETSLKRMIRHHDLKLTPEEARQIVASLSNSHGLTRDEARRALYEAERRVHWSEAEHDEDLRQTCSPCHTLGRVFAQQRDAEEWKLLKATHLAFFPLAESQGFRGSQSGGGDRGFNFETATEAEIEAEMQRRRDAPKGPDRADKVLGELAKKQPLFTPSFEDWQVSRREVLLADRWSLVGHEIGRGAVRGDVLIRRTGPDAFETVWELAYADGARVRRTGKAVLYAGYSWRGRSEAPENAPATEPKFLREVLLLSEDWQTLEGRLFFGDHHELGMDVTLTRYGPTPRILAVENGALLTPSENTEVVVHGQSFPEAVEPGDFACGTGITVKTARRVSPTEVRLVVDVAHGAEQGARQISFRASPGPKALVVHDTVDYIKIFPEEGFARVGGVRIPAQKERFEAWAMNRGKDDKPWTADDFKVKLVKAAWAMEEFPVREDDDDLKFVGALDPATAFFSPNREGPNPERRLSANNIGDVYVVATCTMTVPVIPPKPKKPEPAEPKDEKKDREGPAPGGGEGVAPAEAEKPKIEETPKPAPKPPPPPPAPPVFVTKEFRARGHLLVTVPVYVAWDQYAWDRQ